MWRDNGRKKERKRERERERVRGRKIFCLVFISPQPDVYIEILTFFIPPLLVLGTVSSPSSYALPSRNQAMRPVAYPLLMKVHSLSTLRNLP